MAVERKHAKPICGAKQGKTETNVKTEPGEAGFGTGRRRLPPRRGGLGAPYSAACLEPHCCSLIGQHARPSRPLACSCPGSADGHWSLSAVPAVLDGARLLPGPLQHARTSRTWWHGVCVEVGADLLVYSETSGPDPSESD